MVVDLAVHGQHLFPVRGEEWLPAGLRIHDAQPLVGHDSTPATPDAAPVRPPVPKFAAHLKSLPAHGVGLFANVENAGYSTHGIRVYLLSYAFPFSGGRETKKTGSFEPVSYYAYTTKITLSDRQDKIQLIILGIL